MSTPRAATLQRRGLYAAVALAVLALALYGLWPRARAVDAGVVSRGPLQQLVREEGRTRVAERFRISAPVDGQLQRIVLEPGDRVLAGAPLATLRAASSALLDPARRAAAEAEWQAAGDERAAAVAARDAAQAEQQRSSAELARGRELAQRGLLAAQALDTLEAAARSASANASAAAARLRAAGSRVAAARASLDLQGSDASGAQAQELVVTAPIDGVVLQRLRESAGPVRAGEALLELGDTGRIEAEIDVLSADAVRIAPGMPVRLQRWGGDAALDGRVQRVEPGGFTKVSALGVEEQRVRVVVDIAPPLADSAGDDARRTLGDGYRVEGEFVVWQGEDVLQVPASALFRDGAAWALYRIEDGRARLVTVEIGHLGEQAAQVLGGIPAGAAVVLYPGDSIVDGARVEPRRDSGD